VHGLPVSLLQPHGQKLAAAAAAAAFNGELATEEE